MAKQPTAAASESATMKENTSTTSVKPPSGLCTTDGSPLTAQDKTVLAVLAELQRQGYEMRIANILTSGQPKTAAIILTGRVWE